MLANYIVHVPDIMSDVKLCMRLLTVFSPEYPNFNIQSSFWCFFSLDFLHLQWSEAIKNRILVQYITLINVKSRENYKIVPMEKLIGSMYKQVLI